MNNLSLICQRYFAYAGWVCLALVLGCESSSDKLDATVQGSVTIDGVLADRGTVTFHPVGGGPTAYGTIHKNGSFTLQIGQGNLKDLDSSKIYSGEYVATVAVNADSTPDTEAEEGAPPLPGVLLTSKKYGSQETSGLKYTIKPGRNVLDIPVEGAAADETVDSESGDPEAPAVVQEVAAESGAETDEAAPTADPAEEPQP